MITNGIRYSRLPKRAYGGDLPKYSDGTSDYYSSTYGNMGQQQPSTQNQSQGNFGSSASNVGSKVGNSMGWYAYANQAQQGVRNNIKRKTVVNPKTGETYQYAATNEGQIVEEIAQPYHEKYAQDIKNKEYGGIAAQLAGGPVGQIAYNAIWGKKKLNAKNRAFESEADDAQAEIDAEVEKQRQEEENRQRDLYSRAYLAENPAMGQEGASIYAYGTKGRALPKKALGGVMALGGGDMQDLNSNTQVVDGNTHEQGGVKVADEQGTPVAELEDKEVVVDGDRVLSDRIMFTGNKSFAQKGEELADKKAKLEKNMSNVDMFKNNTAKRNIEKVDQQMNLLFKYQDVLRQNLGLEGNPPLDQKAYGGRMKGYAYGSEDPDNGNTTLSRFNRSPVNNRFNFSFDNEDGGENSYTPPSTEYNPEDDIIVPDNNSQLDRERPFVFGPTSTDQTSQFSSETNTYEPKRRPAKFSARGFENMAPYLDNAINYGLIKQTPKINRPIRREFVPEMAMPMNTKYNINPALIENTRNQREFNRNILDNTSNSNVARANIASGYAAKLRANNQLYGQKENIENQLENQNALNLQSVNSRNVARKQDIDNFNAGLQDDYNWKNVLRDDDIRTQKSKLAAETTEDTLSGIQDRRSEGLDRERIYYDSMKYKDAAGLAEMIGTPEMDRQAKSNQGRARIRKRLKSAGQNKALKEFNKEYGED